MKQENLLYTSHPLLHFLCDQVKVDVRPPHCEVVFLISPEVKVRFACSEGGQLVAELQERGIVENCCQGNEILAPRRVQNERLVVFLREEDSHICMHKQGCYRVRVCTIHTYTT